MAVKLQRTEKQTNEQEVKQIDMRSAFWNNIATFDIIKTQCAGALIKVEQLIEACPKALIELNTLRDILNYIELTCENGLANFELIKENASQDKQTELVGE